ncbi:MAG: iron ABC transporter substrate-binding protein [Acidobacteriota bacterium]
MGEKKSYLKKANLVMLALFLAASLLAGSARGRTITDALGREVEIPDKVTHLICSGSGCPRLLVYLQAQKMLVGVDEGETRKRIFDARPYAFANPWLKDLPMTGLQGGRDNPEAILMLEPQPQVILRTFPASGYDPVELQQKTGIPVITLEYGGLLPDKRPALYQTLRTMGEVTGKSARAEEVIAFFEKHIRYLESKAAMVGEEERPSAFVGGIAFSGAHGYQSTEPSYPPFSLLKVRDTAGMSERLLHSTSHAVIAKEKILDWDPDYLFLDLSTLQLGEDSSGLAELKNDKGYQTLSAVKRGDVYGVLPYNWCTKNYGSILANCYFIGKLLYPEAFKNINPEVRADEIYTFLVGEAVFGKMNAMFDGLAFSKIPLQK